MDTRAKLLKKSKDLGIIQQNIRFLYSCMSEGLVPKGLQFNFTLAKFVNNQNLVSGVQRILDESNSRLLDLIYKTNMESEEVIVRDIESLKDEAINELGEEEGLVLYNQMKNSNGLVKRIESRKFSVKLSKLRIKYQNVNNQGFLVSNGSRKITTHKYKRENVNGEVQGAPFPKKSQKK